MSRSTLMLLAVFLLSWVSATAQPASKGNEPLGEQLYSTHCVACHTTQVHWRAQRLAKDWTSLKAQVRRWQAISGLNWSDGDIAEVTRHLNALYYHFPDAGNQVSLSMTPPSRRR